MFYLVSQNKRKKETAFTKSWTKEVKTNWIGNAQANHYTTIASRLHEAGWNSYFRHTTWIRNLPLRNMTVPCYNLPPESMAVAKGSDPKIFLNKGKIGKKSIKMKKLWFWFCPARIDFHPSIFWHFPRFLQRCFMSPGYLGYMQPVRLHWALQKRGGHPTDTSCRLAI